MAKLAIFGGRPVRKKTFPAYQHIGREERAEVKKVFASGIFSGYIGAWHKNFFGGSRVQEFEKKWASYFGVKNAIAVNSATSGLICAIGASGISPGDEVIVSPYTMSASVTAPLWYGGVPVFSDIEAEYYCLDAKKVETKISKRTKAIIVVDLFGQPYDARALNAIAKKHNLLVIEDCAQAPFAKYRDKFAGTLGDIGIYSLNHHKHIHTGEGGMVVTNDDELAQKIRLIRNHAESVVEGMWRKELTNMVGHNFRLTEMQAAIGIAQLRKLGKLVNKRVENCEYIGEELSKIPGIRAPRTRPGSTHSYYLQAFKFDEKAVGVSRNVFINAVRAELPQTMLRESEGVLLGVGYVKPLYLLPLFQSRTAFGNSGWPFNLADKSVSYNKGDCPIAEQMHEKELFTSELMRPPMKEKDLNDVISAFKKVYEHLPELRNFESVL